MKKLLVIIAFVLLFGVPTAGQGPLSKECPSCMGRAATSFPQGLRETCQAEAGRKAKALCRVARNVETEEAPGMANHTTKSELSWRKPWIVNILSLS